MTASTSSRLASTQVRWAAGVRAVSARMRATVRWVRSRVELPIMADESCYGPFDLERIIRLEAADLVNVQLAKCGSLTVGRAMLRRAHEVGLGTIVGSMMESHVGLGAAASLVAAEPTSEVSDLDAAWWSTRGSTPWVGHASRPSTSW